jgi:LmbE family N-acetylglucosaminyl deacetylase
MMDIAARDALACRADDRLLVFAPHPDDESLACGGLIYRAQQMGADVHVVIATNGDANPWPQRFTEKRWHLDADDARRWGQMRAGEALAALRILGVEKERVTFLQWPDQGLTARLVNNGQESVATLQQSIQLHQPTLVVGPSVHDSHPDHSALALMLKAALRAEGSTARKWSYWLHGRGAHAFDAAAALILTPQERAAKRSAALSHLSQSKFGTSRLLRFVTTTERFLEPSIVNARVQSSWQWHFRSARQFGPLFARWLRVVAINDNGTLQSKSLDLRAVDPSVEIERSGTRGLTIRMQPQWKEAAWVVAKVDTAHRLDVYDPFGWTPCDNLANDHSSDGAPVMRARASDVAEPEAGTAV